MKKLDKRGVDKTTSTQVAWVMHPWNDTFQPESKTFIQAIRKESRHYYSQIFKASPEQQGELAPKILRRWAKLADDVTHPIPDRFGPPMVNVEKDIYGQLYYALSAGDLTNTWLKD
jgi:hypothetical protein